jgi:hypothetical protein
MRFVVQQFLAIGVGWVSRDLPFQYADLAHGGEGNANSSTTRDEISRKFQNAFMTML